jgi:hypothetical protein
LLTLSSYYRISKTDLSAGICSNSDSKDDGNEALLALSVTFALLFGVALAVLGWVFCFSSFRANKMQSSSSPAAGLL